MQPFLLYRIQVSKDLHIRLWCQIAQRETVHISFVQFANKGHGADLLIPESYYTKNISSLHNKCSERITLWWIRYMSYVATTAGKNLASENFFSAYI